MNRREALAALGAKPSPAFTRFLESYFGQPIILIREEEDRDVLGELSGRERVVAVEMVLANLDSPHAAFARAAAILRDERALPRLRALVDHGNTMYLRLVSAKVLYCWVGLDSYPAMLRENLPQLGQYGKSSVEYWISGLKREDAVPLVFMLLQDPDGFVRWCAFGALKEYFGKPKQEFEETKRYTADEVFNNRGLFERRLAELRSQVESW